MRERFVSLPLGFRKSKPKRKRKYTEIERVLMECEREREWGIVRYEYICERDWENMLRVVLAKVFYLFASLLSLERILKCLFIFGKIFQLNSHENDDNFYSRILLFFVIFVLSLYYILFSFALSFFV